VFRRLRREVDVLSTFMYLDNLLVSRTVDVPLLHHIWGVPSDSWSLKMLVRGSSPDVYLSNSEHTEAKLEEYFHVRGDGVVYPGVDVRQFHPDAEPAFTEGRPVVMFVGRFVPGKGVKELIDAFADLSTEAALYLVGEGPLRNELEQLVTEHELEDDVTFMGTVPHEEIQHYFTACDVFCLPSYYESFGLVNIEAMACGRPVVTSGLEPIEEYVVDGANGILVSPGDNSALVSALERLVESPELRRKLGENARETSLEYSWEEQAARFEQYLETASDMS
jgi:glycosyltransferase involved in cell wall biosynthesis